MAQKNNSKNNKLELVRLLIISSAYIAINFNMQGFRAILPLISKEMVFTRTMAGLYTTMFFISGTVMAIFSGRMVDIFLAKRGMLIGVFYVGILMMFHAFAPSFALLIVMGLFAGIGFSIITPSCTKAVKILVPSSSFGFSMGIMQSGGEIGSILGAMLLPLVGAFFGWRIAVSFSGTFAVFMGFLLLKYYKEGREDLRKDKYKNRTENNVHFRDAITVLFKNKHLLSLCFIGMSLGLCLGSIFSHFSLFLVQDLGFSEALVGIGLMPITLGGIVGRLIWGNWSDRMAVGDKRLLYLCIAIIIIVSSLFFSFATAMESVSFFLLIIMAFLMGVGGVGWISVYLTNVAEAAGDSYTGIATGVALTFSRIGMLVSPPIFGYIADLNESYQKSWVYIAIFLTIAIVIFYIIDRKSVV